MLNGVACVNSTFCLAVGRQNDPTMKHAALAERFDGTRWSPASPSSGPLYGVSCPEPTFCMAVGDVDPTYQHPVVETFNGSTWSAVPIPGSTYARLSSVSCPTVRFCMAVGLYYGGSPPGSSSSAPPPTNLAQPKTLAETFDGSGWKVLPSPDPFDNNDYLEAVSCPSTNFCVATGYANLGNRPTRGFIATYDGQAWSVPINLNRESTNSTFLGVSCPVTSFCAAAGSRDGPFVEAYDGSTWSISPFASPLAGTNAYLAGVSCPRTVLCVAVGTTPTVPVAELFDGSVWSPLELPGIGNGQLVGVSCVGTDFCAAVGSSGPTTALQPLVLMGIRGAPQASSP